MGRLVFGVRMEYRHIELKSGRRIRRYRDSCPSCQKFKGYKDKNALGRDCCSCANIKIGIRNKGLKRSKKTKLKQSVAAFKRYNDSDWSAKDRSKKGYSATNSTKVYEVKNTPEQNKIKHTMRTLLWQKIKKRNMNKNYNSTFTLLEYSVNDLIIHLESKFAQGMTWDNHGEWHIDHIMPDSSFNYSSFKDVDFKKSWELSNLQPMWAEDNYRKSDKIPGGVPFQRL